MRLAKGKFRMLNPVAPSQVKHFKNLELGTYMLSNPVQDSYKKSRPTAARLDLKDRRAEADDHTPAL